MIRQFLTLRAREGATRVPHALAFLELAWGVRGIWHGAGGGPGAAGLLQLNVRIPPAAAPSNNVLASARLGNNGLPEALQIAVKSADLQQ